MQTFSSESLNTMSSYRLHKLNVCRVNRIKDRLKQEYRAAAKSLDTRIAALQDELTHMQGSLEVSARFDLAAMCVIHIDLDHSRPSNPSCQNSERLLPV